MTVRGPGVSIEPLPSRWYQERWKRAQHLLETVVGTAVMRWRLCFSGSSVIVEELAVVVARRTQHATGPSLRKRQRPTPLGDQAACWRTDDNHSYSPQPVVRALRRVDEARAAGVGFVQAACCPDWGELGEREIRVARHGGDRPVDCRCGRRRVGSCVRGSA